ncbi:MAG TPA: IS1595 family transposase [Xanthobacteraceae bacterium]|nr:IS1595 family transposase [Xanthobacteraceae bacterium]
MAKNQFAEPHFHDEEAARKWLEAARWPNGPTCPHCGSMKHYATKKAGRYRCGEKECRKDYTVQTKSVMERSHAKLTQWVAAFVMGSAGKKGFSAHQLHRQLGCEYNTAWFLHHRVMEAMRRGGLEPPLGGEGKIVEADETYFGYVPEAKRPTRTTSGRKFTKSGRPGPSGKRAIVALVERGGNVRTFHVATADSATVGNIVADNVSRESRLHTDESRLYSQVGKEFRSHERVTHSHGEYARGDVYTNTAENYFSIFKRGMKGVYQHCKEKNLHRYLAEFDFRYNTRKMTDSERAALAVRGGENKRLTYR